MTAELQPALFLDRDGVINLDLGYVYRLEDFHFIEGIFTLTSKAEQLGYAIFIVTNQSGIGRGYYTEADFHKLMHTVCEEFQKHGVHITKVYFCPDHPLQASKMRKPHPGMLFQAAEEYNIDLASSVLIGDSLSDLLAGQAAGIKRLLYFKPRADCVLPVQGLHQPPVFVHSLEEAANFL